MGIHRQKGEARGKKKEQGKRKEAKSGFLSFLSFLFFSFFFSLSPSKKPVKET